MSIITGAANDIGGLPAEPIAFPRAVAHHRDPAEIANAALFLASDESSVVNGSVLFADGGSAQV